MATLLTDLDATCANLGYHEPDRYYAEPDALQNLKHLIWILRRDSETHDYRRHLGRAKVLQTDLLPMLVTYCNETELSDVLLRLLVNLTNPALLLYREQLPSDGPGRKIYLEIIEHLQCYKTAFVLEEAWTVLCARLQKALDIDWAERTEDQGLLIERILVLARNILQVPASPDTERRADNDASLHDQVLWALHQSGLLDIVLYITNTQQENQYHLHAIEIISLMYREQNVDILASSELQRSASEKERDEKELVSARKREQANFNKVVGATRMPPSARHSRFAGTYVFQNLKSISDNDMICHKVVTGPEELNLNKLKVRVKKPKNKIVVETGTGERRSAFSVRLLLREFCLEFLASSYNTVMRDVRRVVTSASSTSDESYLLWAVRFFMEFNRLNGFRLDFISETLSTTWFHWVLGCSDKCMEMAVTDKKNIRLWSRRLHLALQAYREFLMSMQALVKLPTEEAKALALSLQSNVFYVIEYRETVIHLLLHYDESKNSKYYLKDLIETAHIFSRMLEKYCKNQGVGGKVVIQQRRKQKKKTNQKKSASTKEAPQVSLEDRWLEIAQQVTAVLTSDGEQIPTDLVPFDATSDVPIDDQKEDCMRRIQTLLREENFEQAIGLLRSAREVWPEHDYFGAMNLPPEEEQIILYDIFVADIGNKGSEKVHMHESEEEEYEEDEEEEPQTFEAHFKFSDYETRLCNPRVVRACTMLLSGATDGSLSSRSVVAACSLLHRIAWSCKCPGMLFQASLFRVFQAALNAPSGTVHEELRKLAVYIIRQFARVAATNNKVFAELLFWKTVKDSYALENNYEHDPQSKGKSSAWSEEEELELVRLFEENQSNPTNDQDVIDWLIENLIADRTRREVIKKLRDLNLQFTKPTRKSTAQAQSKRSWNNEQDNMLSELYQQYRTEEDTLAKICEAFAEKAEASIIRRMIFLGLIADKKEIKPRKKRSTVDKQDRRKKNVKNHDTTKKGSKSKARNNLIKICKLDKRSVSSLVQKISEDNDGAIQWLVESLADAIEDLQDHEEIGDEEGIPLVPLIASQKEALETVAFIDLLRELGAQPPLNEQENYWRLPGKFNKFDIKERIAILEDPRAVNLGDEEDNQNEEEDEPLELSDNEEETIPSYSSGESNNEEPNFMVKKKSRKANKNKENVAQNFEITEYVSEKENTENNENLITSSVISSDKKTGKRNRKRIILHNSSSEDEGEFNSSKQKINDSVAELAGEKGPKITKNNFVLNEGDISHMLTEEIGTSMTIENNESAKSDSMGRIFDDLVDSDEEHEITGKRPRSESSGEETTINKRNASKKRMILSDDED